MEGWMSRRRVRLCQFQGKKDADLVNDGRSPKEVETRLDRLIDEIRTRYQKDIIGKPKKDESSGDVLIVAHGHILRAFAMRWINKGLTEGVSLLLDGTSLAAFSFV